MKTTAGTVYFFDITIKEFKTKRDKQLFVERKN